MVKILSLDIGIRNLAFCLFETTLNVENKNVFAVKNWDIINLTEESFDLPICEGKNKRSLLLLPCKNNAKFQKRNNHENFSSSSFSASSFSSSSSFYCFKHAKQHPFMVVPSSLLKMSLLKKKNYEELLELANKFKLQLPATANANATATTTIPKKKQKQELLFLFETFIQEKCFEEIKSKNASTLDLITIGKNIKSHFNRIFLKEGKIDYILIENQISPIANRMKSIQGMIVQYFLMMETSERIEIISAANKLKCFENNNNTNNTNTNNNNNNNNTNNMKTTTYNSRKKMGIEKCKETLLSNLGIYEKHYHFFLQHKKKDDLADCFLQGRWFITMKHLEKE